MFKKITSAYEVLSNREEDHRPNDFQNAEKYDKYDKYDKSDKSDRSDKWRQKQDSTTYKYYNKSDWSNQNTSENPNKTNNNTNKTHHHYNNSSTNDYKNFYYHNPKGAYTNTNFNYKYSNKDQTQYNKQENFSNNYEGVKPSKYIIFRDPRTGNYFRIRVDKDENQSDSPRWQKEPIDDHLYQKHYYENDIRIEFRHLFGLLFIFGTTLYFYSKLNRMDKYLKDSNAIIYKNAIYYPKNRDPIIEDMIKNKGYTFPDDIYSVKLARRIRDNNSEYNYNSPPSSYNSRY
jgi:hypothetical protein